MVLNGKDIDNMEHIKPGAKRAEKKVEKVFEGSVFFNDDIGKYYPRFEPAELVTGEVLGSGGFGVVHEVSRVNLAEVNLGDVHEASLALQHENRKFISDHCIRQKQEEEGGGDARYAIKTLLPEIISDPDRYAQGIKDLVVETHFLSRIEHPHIIKMRAFSNAGMFQPNYFLVLDRLYDTLETRIRKWRKQKKITRRLSSLVKAKKDKKKFLAEERLEIAFGIVAAIQYLHDKKIVHRDLKPENIGFDVRGDVKIFDFGLAKELKQEDKINANHNLYNLTACIGTILYMAPEVYEGQPYNQSADLYSFALCLWEMFSLCEPYEGVTSREQFENHVIIWKCRPEVKDKWPLPIKLLLNRAWSANMDERPTAPMAVKILKNELAALRSGNQTGLEHNTRKSTYVMRKTTGLRTSSDSSLRTSHKIELRRSSHHSTRWLKRFSQKPAETPTTQMPFRTLKNEYDETELTHNTPKPVHNAVINAMA